MATCIQSLDGCLVSTHSHLVPIYCKCKLRDRLLYILPYIFSSKTRAGLSVRREILYAGFYIDKKTLMAHRPDARANLGRNTRCLQQLATGKNSKRASPGYSSIDVCHS